MNALLETLNAWAAALPGTSVRVTRPAIPGDDDYGLQTIVAFAPVNPLACPLEIGIVGGDEPSAYVFLDRWAAIAKRAQLRIDARMNDRIGLFREPEAMSPERLRMICDAVATGAVQLEVGAWNGRLVWTSGSLRLADGPLPMHGPGTQPPLLGLLASIGVVRRVAVNYVPWQ